MKSMKLILAIALFVTSVSFEEQVLITDKGLASNWELSVGSSSAFAVQAAAKMFE